MNRADLVAQILKRVEELKAAGDMSEEAEKRIGVQVKTLSEERLSALLDALLF